MSNIEQKRRKRPNMTHQEKDVLLELVSEHINIIENKKTDGITSNMKNEEWEKIASNFNSHGYGPIRDAANLRTVWENLKKASRKVSAETRMEMLKTGGGTSKDIKTDPILLRTIDLIRPSVEGMINVFDSDNVICSVNNEAVVVTEGSGDTNVSFKPLEVNWGQYTTKMLKSALHPALQITESTSDIITQTIDDRTNETPVVDNGSTDVNFSTPCNSKTVTPRWTKRRRPMLSKQEEPLSKVHKLKAEALVKCTEQSTQEHMWNEELHSLRLEQEKIKLEIEKIRLEREKELLKQERIRTEMLLKNNTS